MSDTSFIYQKVTDAILARLDAGVIPWRKPWTSKGFAGSPRNFVSHKPYRGINIWLLAGCYETPFWLSFNQCRSIGAKVRKGEKGTTVVFWSILKRKDKADPTAEKKVFFLRYYTVFNVEQCDGIAPEKIEKLKRAVGIIPDANAPKVDPIEAAENIVKGFENCPQIKHGGDRAFYSPALDYVGLPNLTDFASVESYHAVQFHELIHSTGHASRLSREGITKDVNFGSERYSKEELVAEFGSTFLCAVAGIEREELTVNAAAYIASWRKKLSEDPKLLIGAASQAQHAADYILQGGNQQDSVEEDEETSTAPEEALAAS